MREDEGHVSPLWLYFQLLVKPPTTSPVATLVVWFTRESSLFFFIVSQRRERERERLWNGDHQLKVQVLSPVESDKMDKMKRAPPKINPDLTGADPCLFSRLHESRSRCSSRHDMIGFTPITTVMIISWKSNRIFFQPKYFVAFKTKQQKNISELQADESGVGRDVGRSLGADRSIGLLSGGLGTGGLADSALSFSVGSTPSWPLNPSEPETQRQTYNCQLRNAVTAVTRRPTRRWRRARRHKLIQLTH